jgi:hypothetical protein
VDIINSILITVYSFWRSRHTLWRARKQILPLIRLNFAVLSTWPKLPTGVAAWPLLRFSFVSGVLGLQIRRGQIRWKVNTSGYNFYEWTLPRFYHLQVQILSGTRATNLPCFVNGEGTYNFYFQSFFPHQFQPISAMFSPYLERRFLSLISYNL